MDSASDNNNISYQVVLGVVIPLLIIIIIAVVLFFVLRNHPTMVRKSTSDEQTVHYENEAFRDATKPSRTDPSNASESAYDNIDDEDIDMSANVYDQLDTDKVEYETVH